MNNPKEPARSVVEFSSDLEEAFFKSLEAKTNWGRNDLKEMFKQVNKDMLIQTLLNKIEENNVPTTCETL